MLGINRTTVSTAYELLEEHGLIEGQVGRGSFVTGKSAPAEDGVNWPALLAPGAPSSAFSGQEIGFVMSRPSRDLFPLDDFRASCAAVLERRSLADILQLGSPSGYEPLRRRLLNDARAQGLAGPDDDLIITNGCQQALDLIGRVLIRPGDAVAVEDPVYPGLKNLLAAMGAKLLGIPIDRDGMEIGPLERAMREGPRFLVATSNFQNPTGATLPLGRRADVLSIARAAGVPVVENDAYGELRYSGDPLPALKQLDSKAGTVLLRSFSKVSFPGLRVGWALGPKPLIDRLRQAKEAADLHTDQLSQAVLLEFMESGRLEAHRQRVLAAGAERLAATIEACRRYLPPGTQWTEPEGGMNVWVRLPAPIDAGDLLQRARGEGVAFLPGRYFAVSRSDPGALRLSFAGLPPARIQDGIHVLGILVARELEETVGSGPAPAMV
jgi:2-aminoadipate transaminase